MARVLVVDDDPNLSKLMEIKLIPLGHEVFTCRSAKRACEFARTVMPDMVFLDAMLEDGTGYAVARQMRQDAELYKVGILFQSVADDMHDVEHALEHGGDEYIIKPYSLKKLLEKLEQLQRLGIAQETRCATTNLPGVEALRREVDRALFRKEPLGLCYAFMKGLRAYKQEYGPRGEQKIAAYSAKVIEDVITELQLRNTFISHIGGAYFMVKTELGDYHPFAEALKRQFRERLKELRATGIVPFSSKDSKGLSRESRSTGLVVAATSTDKRQYRNAHEMFATLRKSETVGDKYNEKVHSGVRRERQKAGHERWVD